MNPRTESLVEKQERQEREAETARIAMLPRKKIPAHAKTMLNGATKVFGQIVQGRVPYVVERNGELRRVGEKKKHKRFTKPQK